VELVGEVLQGKGAQAMTKESDGVWSVTIGPLPPEIWIYNFRIDGVSLPDPANISQMPRAAGTAISSFVEVSGDGPAFYDARPVPHGEVRMVLYESKAMGVDRYMWVYTPPGYEKSNAKYPVFYLLHGNGETQSGWVMNGRANIIMDNLIADGKAVPMVVVMPHGHPIQSASVGAFSVVPPKGQPGMGNFTLFTEDLLAQIIPTIEKDFRVYADADHRAIGGLSMGAMQRRLDRTFPPGVVPLRSCVQRRIWRSGGDAGHSRYRDPVPVEGVTGEPGGDEEGAASPVSWLRPAGDRNVSTWAEARKAL